MKKKSRKKRKKRKQTVGWLNRYDFFYAGRDSVYTALATFNKMMQGLIRNASNQSDHVAKKEFGRHLHKEEKKLKEICFYFSFILGPTY